MSLSPANAERLKQAFQRCRDMEGTLSEQLEAYAAAGREFFPVTPFFNDYRKTSLFA